MNRVKSVIRRSILLKSLGISIIAFLISYALYHGLDKYLYYVGIDTSNLSYLQQYYEKNNSSDSPYPYSDDILILSTNDSTNRDSIAIALDTIFNYHPKVVGIDIFFKSNSIDNDSLLKSVIRKHADSIVLAQIYGEDGHLIKSIFDGDSQLTFGLIHAYNDIKFPYKDKYYYNFAYEIARKNNPGLFDNEKKMDNFVVNYLNKSFDFVDLHYFKNASQEEKDYININNKIVLIGAYNDVFDIHPTQFVIEDKRLLSGIKFHAYAINSLIHQEQAMKELSIESYENILIFWTFCFVYSLSFVLFNDENIEHYKWFKPLTTYPRSVILTIIAAILIWGVFDLMEYSKTIPNAAPLFIAIFVINTFSDCLSRLFIFNKY